MPPYRVGMDDDAPAAAKVTYPEYRPGSPGFGLPTLGMAGILMGMAQIARNDPPPVVLFGLPVVVLALIGFLYVAHRRSGTLTSPDQIAIRTMFGTRTYAWPDIQAIEIEGNPSAIGSANVAHQMVAIYDRTGRRILLPHVDSRRHPALNEELDRLRALWERHRGTDWTSSPEVAGKVDKAHRSINRASAWIVAMLAGFGTFMIFSVVVVIMVLSGVTDIPSAVYPGAAVGASVVVLVAVLLARRRRDPG